jgi:hypothetical protein
MGKIILATLVLLAMGVLCILSAQANIGWVRPLITATNATPGVLNMNFVVPPSEEMIDYKVLVADGDFESEIRTAPDNFEPGYWNQRLQNMGFHQVSSGTVPGGSSTECHMVFKWDRPGPHQVTVAVVIRERKLSESNDKERFIPTAKTVTIPNP